MKKLNKKLNKKQWIGLGVLVILIAAMLVVYAQFREKPVEGSKAISIEVLDAEGDSVLYEFTTDAEFLRQAMEEADGLTFSGVESQYGLTIDTVNGLYAVFGESDAYWAFYVNGEYCNYGIDTQPVEDGDAFQIIYTAE